MKLFVDRANQISSLTFSEYRGYVIGAWARPELKGFTSIGVVYKGDKFKADKFGTKIRVHRIEGKWFESKEEAEQQGVKLSKEWIDKQVKVYTKNE